MTDKHIPASKLLALPRYTVGPDSSVNSYIKTEDLRALIDEAPEVESVVDDSYQEGTAERLRLICSKLGIGAPVSNEEIMLCQFSLLGSIRRKIDEIYIPPPHNTDLTKLVGELVEALEDVDELIGIEPFEHVAQEAADAHRNIRELLTRAKEYLK